MRAWRRSHPVRCAGCGGQSSTERRRRRRRRLAPAPLADVRRHRLGHDQRQRRERRGRRGRGVGAAVDGAGLTVAVSGTNLTATVDASGHFVLANVPSGTVTLHFTGSGVDATLTIADVATNDQVQLTHRSQRRHRHPRRRGARRARQPVRARGHDLGDRFDADTLTVRRHRRHRAGRDADSPRQHDADLREPDGRRARAHQRHAAGKRRRRLRRQRAGHAERAAAAAARPRDGERAVRELSGADLHRRQHVGRDDRGDRVQGYGVFASLANGASVQVKGTQGDDRRRRRRPACRPRGRTTSRS